MQSDEWDKRSVEQEMAETSVSLVYVVRAGLTAHTIAQDDWRHEYRRIG